MKDKVIRIRADQELIDKVDYLQEINGYKSKSETIRKEVEKEYKRETYWRKIPTNGEGKGQK